MIVHKSVSLADQVFEHLENDILTGVYPKGELLTEAKISESLGVSRTPVREALRRLEQEHIIEESSKGMIVIGITPEDADTIYEIRERIEGMAARLCAINATDEEIAHLREVLELQSFYVDKNDAEKIKLMDNDFHHEIYRLTGSAVLFDTLASLHKKIQKFRKTAISNSSRANESYQEHLKVLDAIERRDADLADKMMTLHVANARGHLNGIVDNMVKGE